MVKHDMSMVRGDTLAFFVSFKGAVRKYISSLTFSAKTADTVTNYIFSKTLGDGVTKIDEGLYRVRVAPSDTADIRGGKYVYDLQLGIGEDIYTLLKGRFTIIQDVTYNK